MIFSHKLCKLGFIGLVVFIALPVHAQTAPSLYFRTTGEAFAPGSEFTVGVFIDSVSLVNAYDIEIGYSPATLEFISFNSANSVIDFWRGGPEHTIGGIVRLEGGSANPFSGRAGEIVKINFRATAEGPAGWSFRRANVYYADGKGTLAETNRSLMTIQISENAPIKNLTLTKDGKPPVIEEFGITKSPVDGSSLAFFRVEDKESGLKAVKFRSRKWLFWSGWQTAESPFPIPGGVWALQIEAVDNQGNTAKDTLYVKSEIAKKAALVIVAIILLGWIFKNATIFTRR